MNRLCTRFLPLTVLGFLALAACGPAPVPQGISDPDEARNREFHEFNVALDRNVLRPLSGGEGGGSMPAPLQRGLSNFADNLDVPGDVVNDILQLRLGKAVENTLRFVVNTTIGLGGILDPATAMGVEGKKTDFGETLHLWGMPEGNYVELPLLGPTTTRDQLGTLVDYVLNPLRILIPAPESYYLTGARLASKIGERGRYSETFDSILYDSADSYAQTRLLFLQNRRFELGQDSGDAGFIDPYEDPYAE